MKTLILFLALLASITANAQQKTWGGTSTYLFPNMANGFRVYTNGSVSLSGGVSVLDPTIAATSTPYVLDTSLTHTSGSLLDVKNNGTNVVEISHGGRLAIGKGAVDYISGGDGSFGQVSDMNVGGSGGVYHSMYAVQLDTSYSYYQAYAGATQASIYAEVPDGTAFSLRSATASAYLALYNTEGVESTKLEPTTAATSTPYVLDTTLTHTSGNLLTVANNSTNKFVVDYAGNTTATSVNKVAITEPATSATLTIANGKTLTANNSITLAGTDSTTITFPTTSATIARTDTAQTFTGSQSFGQINTTGDVINSASGGIYAGRSSTFSYRIGVSDDAILSRKAAANWQLGFTDAAAPVAQTLSVQSVVAGTSNTAGSAWTLNGSVGTGTGAGGSIIFKTAPAGSTGTSQNALVTALTISGEGDLVQPVAKTYSVATGTNQRAGNATLVGGTITVNNTTVTANTLVIYSRKTIGGTVGNMSYTTSAATSFTITSDSGTDTSTISYFLIENP